VKKFWLEKKDKVAIGKLNLIEKLEIFVIYIRIVFKAYDIYNLFRVIVFADRSLIYYFQSKLCEKFRQKKSI
jgi:hypothetical protein